MVDASYNIARGTWTPNNAMRMEENLEFQENLAILSGFERCLFPSNMPLDVPSRQSTGPYLNQDKTGVAMTGGPMVGAKPYGIELPGGSGISCTPPGAPPIPWSLFSPPAANRPMQAAQGIGRDGSITQEQCTHSGDGSDDDVSTAPSSTFHHTGAPSPNDAGEGLEKLERDLVDADMNPSLVGGEFQTLMLKNIPCRSSQQEVLDAIEAVGFGEAYNFFYLPIRRGHTQNFGYAFIGFGDAETTQAFAVAMTGYRFPGRRSPKACAVAPARIQGFCNNVEHFQKTQCMRRKNRPLLSISL